MMSDNDDKFTINFSSFTLISLQCKNFVTIKVPKHPSS